MNPNHNPNAELNKKGMTVIVKNNNIQKAMRTLKNRMRDEGVFAEMRKREFYEKPSDRKRREKAMAAKRHQKRVADSEL